MKIYNHSNIPVIDIDITEGAVRKYELMKEDYIKLDFSLGECIPIKTGYYVDFSSEYDLVDGEKVYRYPLLSGLWRFAASEDYIPSYDENTGGYAYSIQLDCYYMGWKNKILKYQPTGSGQESAWSLTDFPHKFCKIIEKNLSARGLAYKGMPFIACVAEEYNSKPITLTFNSTSILNAISSIAESVNDGKGCDWWVERNVIKFGLVENDYDVDGNLLVNPTPKDQISLRLGESVSFYDTNKGQDSKATRIYAYGSERNITKRYRKELRFFPTENGQYYRDEFRNNITGDCFDLADSDYTAVTKDNTLEKLLKVDGLVTDYQKISSDSLPSYHKIQVKEWSHEPSKMFMEATIKTSSAMDMSAVAKVILYTKSGDMYSVAHSITLPLKSYNQSDNKQNHWFQFSFTDDKFYLYKASELYYRIEVTPSVSDILATSQIDSAGTLKAQELKVKKTVDIECYGENGYIGKGKAHLNAKFVGDKEADFSWLQGGLLPDTIYYTIPSIKRSKVQFSYFTNASQDDDAINAVVNNRLMLPTMPCYVKESLLDVAHQFTTDDIKEAASDGYVCIYGGHGYVDAEPSMSEAEAVEEVDTFENVYPTKEVNVVDAWLDRQEAEKWEDDKTETGLMLQVWRIRTDLSNFSNEYRIDDSTRFSVSFNKGVLNGMTFEVEYIKSQSTKNNAVLEIIRSDKYTVPMPNDTFHPSAGDTFNLFNYDTDYLDEELAPVAEKKLLAETLNLISERKRDDKTYNVTLMSDWVYNNGNVREILLGQRATIAGVAESLNRIIGIECPLDYPYDSPKVIVGKTSAYSRFKDLQSKIKTINHTGESYAGVGGGGGGGNTIPIITTESTTEETDANVYSAARVKQDYLTKKQEDFAPFGLTLGRLVVKKGMNNGTSSGNASIGGDLEVQGASTLTAVTANTIGTYEMTAAKAVTGNLTTGSLSAAEGTTTVDADGIKTRKEAKMRTVVFGDYLPGLITGAAQGAKIDESGDAKFKSVSISGYLEVPEIRFNRATVQLGIGIRSVGGGIIEEVIPDTDADGNPLMSGRAALKLEDGEIGAIEVGDKCLGFWHNLTGNSTADRDDRNGDYELRGFSSVYFRIDAIFASEQAYRDYDTAATDKECISKYFHYVLRGSNGSDGWNQRHHPSPNMHFGMIANNIYTDRQALKIETTQYDLSLTRMTEWNYTHSNIMEVGGLLDGFSMQAERYNEVTGEYETYTKEFKGHGRVLGQCYIFGQIDKFERQGYYCTVFQSKNGFIMPNETEMETVKVYTGYGEEVTEKFPYIKVTRDSGDSASDAVWNAEHTSVDNPFPITFADLRIDAIERISTEFHVYASDGVNQTRTSTITFE